MRFYQKLSFIIAFITLLAAAIVSVGLMQILDEDIEELMMTQTKQQALVFTIGLEREILMIGLDNLDQIQENLEKAITYEKKYFDFVIRDFVLIDTNYIALASSGGEESEEENYHLHKDIRNAIENDTVYISDDMETYLKKGWLYNSIDIVQPIHVNGKLVAVIEAQLDITRSFDKMYQRYSRFENTIIYMVIASLVLMIFILYLIIRRIVIRPVIELKEVTDKVKNGDLSGHVLPKGNNEVSLLSRSFNEMVDGLKERLLIKDLFGRYVSKEIRDEVVNNKLQLGGEQREVSILFLDIKNFTKMSNQKSPEEVVVILNEFFTTMVDAINNNDGIINKYIGDSVLAVFGAPLVKGNPAANSILAGIDMFTRLKAFNEKRLQKGGETLGIRIGIHTGQVIAGTIGSKERMEYTVIGDAVNRASRIEQLGKQLKTDFLVSRETIVKAGKQFLLDNKIKLKGPFTGHVKGIEEKISIFAVSQ